jgi:nicotinamidase-related amidase
MTDPALLVVDLQRAFDDAEFWGRRNNPSCEANIAALVDAWRARDLPVVFVRHDSTEVGSPLAPGEPGNAFKDALTGEPDLLVTKSVHSSFHGVPDLDAWLRDNDCSTIVVSGISTDWCCETTARLGCDLGYEVVFPLDATHTFDRTAPSGDTIPADEVARVTAATLDGEFVRVTTTEALVGARHLTR